MTLPTHATVAGLSGERFTAVYQLAGTREEAHARAVDVCLEQTVEFPADLVPAGDIEEHIIGRIESFEPSSTGYTAAISFPVEIVGDELTQLLNVIFGNISIKPGIRLRKLTLPDSLLAKFKGPRFGQVGWRALLNIHDRPLLCTALKPMGLTAAALADLAYRFALGGLDIIKDDHGLANQPFATYQERVELCSAAVERANRETGLRCIYMPNVSAPTDQIVERALFAKQAGAGALLICPGLTGFDTMRMLADDDQIALPLMSHPSWYGSMVTSHENGISHYALYGQIQRLAGADASIYPNFGGRFSFSRDECRSIAEGCQAPMGHLKPIFATPGGGMSMEKIPAMRELYGDKVIYLIGGGLHRYSDDLVENVRYFIRLVQGQ